MATQTVFLEISVDRMLEDINHHLAGWLECAEEMSDQPLTHEGRYIVLRDITNSKGEKVNWSLPLIEIHEAYHNYGSEDTCSKPIKSIQAGLDKGKGVSGITNIWKRLKGI